MTTDADATFAERNINRIDIAQEKTDEYFGKADGSFYMGIGFDSKKNRVPTEDWWQFPVFLRKMPDSCLVENGTFYFIESKGCSDTLKLKHEDIECYDIWEGNAPICMSLYSTENDRLKIISYKQLKKIAVGCDTGVYDDNNKKYYDIPWGSIPSKNNSIENKKRINQMADKKYINMCWFREKKFDNGGSVINCGFKIEELQKHADENGWVNMVIAERKTVSDKGYTHYAYEDEFKPKTQQSYAAEPDVAEDDKMPWDK